MAGKLKITRKTFQAMAEIVADMEDRKEAWRVGNRMAAYFRTENPMFDRGRFLRACGLEARY